MIKDGDIRRFMDKYRMAMPENDRFMENLVSQIDLLPVPGKMNADEGRTLSEDMVRLMASKLKKHYRIQAVIILVANLLFCISLLFAISAVFGTGTVYSSQVMNMLADWRYVIFGILSAICIGLSLSYIIPDQA